MPTLAEAASMPFIRRDPRIRCGVADWITSLDAEEGDGAVSLLADRTRTTTSLYRLFNENGFSLQYDSLVRHRNGRCSCP
jgi:hypothetical protein